MGKFMSGLGMGMMAGACVGLAAAGMMSGPPGWAMAALLFAMSASSEFFWETRTNNILGGIFGGKLRCGGKIQLIPIEEVLDGPTDRRIDNINLDGPCRSENEYMKRYSAANYAHRVRVGLER